MPYHETIGYQRTETSFNAAVRVALNTRNVRDKVADFLAAVLAERGPMTADEIAAVLGLSILTVRPRVTDLNKAGRIEDTGARRQTGSGNAAIVWRIKE